MTYKGKNRKIKISNNDWTFLQQTTYNNMDRHPKADDQTDVPRGTPIKNNLNGKISKSVAASTRQKILFYFLLEKRMQGRHSLL